VASSEWDDTGNTEVTSGSVSETSSQASSSHSDLSAKDILGNVAESSAGQGIQHVCNCLILCLSELPFFLLTLSKLVPCTGN